ncbi:MAG: DUF5005 domain-containing protein [Phaeodactylibacter sp.]|nr:DUF5005 domain-containing protein [Phaeodactylibacter sp.]MCB9276166.1 DUF5005 domain-containing protein [Lewinellaceae bacterium]
MIRSRYFFVSTFFFLLLPAALFFAGCEKEEDDFTKGSFYPNLEEPTDTSGTTIEEGCWEAPVSIRKAEAFNAYFTRYGGGWTGGDATYSIPLPDGRQLWLFGDTFLGIVNANRSRPATGLINNTFVVQDGDDFTTLYSGSAGNASAFVKPQEAGWWYWPGHGVARGDTLEVVLFGFKNESGGAWGFAYTSIDVAKFTLPDISLVSIERKVEGPTVNYGACVMEEDGYYYLYGAEKDGLAKYLHVARVPVAEGLAGSWSYYDGVSWVDDPDKSARLFGNVSEQFSVFRYEGRYYLLTQHHILGGEAYRYRSDSPVGPFTDKLLLYCTPQTGGNIFTYNAFAHTQFLADGALLVSYNVNSFEFSDLFTNADNYRPYFVWVEGWE